MFFLTLLMAGLFAALCYCIGVPKGYSAAICIVGGIFGGLIAVIVLLLLPDREQEAVEYSRRKESYDREISALKQRISELEAVQKPSESETESGVEAEAPEKASVDDVAWFPARTSEVVACPRCGRRQGGNRNACYSCKIPFQYENESCV